jgi:tRNA dimethylallyltransferase
VKPKVIAIVGPTASGKSALGLFLAQKLGGEIVCADSRQIYKGMEVISRAPNTQELRTVPHHLVSFQNPAKKFSAGEYKKMGTEACSSILQNNKIPIVVGGTGFYADSLLRGLTLPEVAPNKKLRASLAKKTPAQLLAILKKIDPKSAERVDPKNIVRLVRAIEVAKAVGPIPTLSQNSPYETLWLGILPSQQKHARSIAKGVETRLKAGMVAEARRLRAKLSKKRFLELGFEFNLLAQFLDKKITKQELIGLLVRGEEKYAARQMRWFKRNPDIRWVKNKTEVLRLAKEFLR